MIIAVYSSILEKQFYIFDRNLSKYPIDVYNIKSFNFIDNVNEDILIKFQETQEDIFLLKIKHIDKAMIYVFLINFIFLNVYLIVGSYFSINEAMFYINKKWLQNAALEFKNIYNKFDPSNQLESEEVQIEKINLFYLNKIIFLSIILFLHITCLYQIQYNSKVLSNVIFFIVISTLLIIIFLGHDEEIGFGKFLFISLLFSSIYFVLNLAFNYCIQILNKKYYKFINVLFLLLIVVTLMKILSIFYHSFQNSIFINIDGTKIIVDQKVNGVHDLLLEEKKGDDLIIEEQKEVE